VVTFTKDLNNFSKKPRVIRKNAAIGRKVTLKITIRSPSIDG
jgi:hypothetical protein